MTLNPFVELARDPVGILSAVGYVFLLVAVLVVGIPHAVRLVSEVYADWLQNRTRDKWERLYGEGVGYIPPTKQSLMLMWAFFVVFVAFEAVAALVWVLGGGLA